MAADPNAVFLALRKQANGKDEHGNLSFIRPGDLIPQAAKWPRLEVSIERGDVLMLTPDACIAIQDAAQKRRAQLKAAQKETTP